MKTLLIAYHSQTGNTIKLVDAAYHAAKQATSTINVVKVRAGQVTIDDFRNTDAYLFATPENFGYMSGELKALFDRTYELCREQAAGKSYALLISCDNDGSGAKHSIERILNGYKMKDSGLCVVAKGDITEQNMTEAYHVGEYFAVALESGVI